MTRQTHLSALLILALLGLSQTACKKDTPQPNIAVKVNGEAISSAEVEGKLGQYAHLPAEQKKFAAGSILDSLTDSELLRQAAIKDKLDADAEVKAKLASATRMVLAKAYIDKTMASVTKPDPAKVKAYYDQQPARYADRKVFDLREINIETKPDTLAEIESHVQASRKSAELVGWLQSKNIPHDDQPLLVPAEKVVEPILAKLSVAQAGEVIILPGKQKMTLLYVNHVQAQPLTLAEATPMIEQTLYENGKKEAMQTAMQQLREQAKIEYFPPYEPRPAKP